MSILRLQDTLKTLFRCSGKYLYGLQQIYSGNVPNFPQNRLSFIEDITKKPFWSLFSGHGVQYDAIYA